MNDFTPGNYLEDLAVAVQKFSSLRIAHDIEPWVTRSLKAPRFLLPTGGYALSPRDIDLNAPYRLPYPDTVLEFGLPYGGRQFPTVILASEFSDPEVGLGIRIREFVRLHPGEWRPYYDEKELLCGRSPFTPDHDGVYVRAVDIDTGALLDANAVATENARVGCSKYSEDSHLVVLGLIALLQCVNVEVKAIPAPARLNAKRVKQGKLPFVEYKRLVVRGVTEKYVTGAGAHASPRQHLRRGHIRRLPNTRTVWVSQCLVGDPKKGLIVKDYVVKP